MIKNPIIINALRRQSPRNSRTEGRGMADRSREEMFMQLKFTAGVEFADVTAGFPVEVFYFC